MIEYGKIRNVYKLLNGDKVYITDIIQKNEIIGVAPIEYEQSIHTERESLFKDIIEAMAILTNGSTKKVTLEIKIDDKERIRILKRWSV